MLLTDNYGQSVEISIPDNVCKPCVNVSGGADSALMLYMLVEYGKTHNRDFEITVLTNSRSTTRHYNAKYATNVVASIINHTKTNSIKQHHIFYEDNQSRRFIDKQEKMLYDNSLIDFTIQATTQNPPRDVEHLREGRVRRRDPNNVFSILENHTLCDMQVYKPFIKVDKRLIAAAYKEYELNWLLSSTRSCEGDTEVPCKSCWWCKEREWAFTSV